MAEQNSVRPLTTDELRASACKWTLAGDVGLLAHLQQLSEKIIIKSEEAEASVNNLIDRVEDTCTDFSNVSNQFLSLQNSQFLENRVYDDETPTEEIKKPVVERSESQQETLAKYKEAVAIGLDLLDTHFEQVQVLECSDSDEEPSGSDPTKVWRPKQLYAKPLPLLIGSAEWWADDNVGLGEFQENEDSEPELTLSDSEDVCPGAEKRVRLSTSSSSSDQVVLEPKRPPIPPTMSASPLVEPSLPKPTSNIQNGSEDLFKPANGLFSPYGPERDFHEPLFGAEPAPRSRMQESTRDLFGPASDDLFSDNPDTGVNFHSNQVPPNIFDPVKKPLVSGTEISPAGIPKADVPTTSKKTESLFDDDDDDDGDSLFSDDRGGTQIMPKPVSSRVSNLFAEELNAKLGTVVRNHDPNEEKAGNAVADKQSASSSSAQSKETKTKKPLGLFGDEVDDEDFLFVPAKNKSTVSNVRAMGNAASSLFDDDGDDDLFGSSKSKVKNTASENKKGALFDAKVDIRSDESMSKPSSKSTDLFSGDLFSDDLESDLFGPKPSGKSVSKVTLPSMNWLPSNDSKDNSPQPWTGPKASTPAVQGTPAMAVSARSSPPEDLFGGISEVDDCSGGGQSLLRDQSSVLEEESWNEANDAGLGIVEDESKDLGFIENTDQSVDNSGNLDNNSKDSPANWFHPQLSSTRSAAAVNETSGYKTGIIGPGTDLGGTPSGSDISNATKPLDKRISSISKEITKRKKSHEGKKSSILEEDELFHSKDVKSFVKAEEEIDDLFSAPSRLSGKSSDCSGNSAPSRISGKSSDWRPVVDETDDLFGIVTKPVTLPAGSSNALFPGPSGGLEQGSDLLKVPTPQRQSVVLDQDACITANTVPPRTQPALVTQALLDNTVDDDLFSLGFKTDKITSSRNVEASNQVDSDRGNLFSPKTFTKPSSGKATPQSDDLFGGPPKSSALKPSSIFDDDDDDNSLFDDGRNKLPDNVSVSSSRSSLFDEPSLGKSTLPSIFENKVDNKSQLEPNIKVSLFENVDNDFDLFVKNPQEAVTEAKNETTKPIGDKNYKLGNINTMEPDEMIKSSLNVISDDLFVRSHLHPEQSSSNTIDKSSKNIETENFGSKLVESEVAKPKPPSSLNITKTSDLLRETATSNTKEAVSKKIGKLNIPAGLKINPSALLPGAKPAKQIDSGEDVPDAFINKEPGESSVVIKKPNSSSSVVATSLGESSSIAITPDHVLPSAMRNRARISVKRRPQSRKARHEALRTSGIDFVWATEDSENLSASPGPSGSDRESSCSLFHSAENSPSPAFISPEPSNFLSPSTDEEDYFNVPELDYNYEKEDQSIFRKEVESEKSNFPAEKEENLLFDGAPVISPSGMKENAPKEDIDEKTTVAQLRLDQSAENKAVEKSRNTEKLLTATHINIPNSDSVDDLFSSAKPSQKKGSMPEDDLFGVSSPPLLPKKQSGLFSEEPTALVPSKRVKPDSGKAQMNSFFGDSDDDDDIFSANAAAPPLIKTAEPATVVPPVPKTRLETVKVDIVKEPFIDPLGLLQEHDE